MMMSVGGTRSLLLCVVKCSVLFLWEFFFSKTLLFSTLLRTFFLHVQIMVLHVCIILGFNDTIAFFFSRRREKREENLLRGIQKEAREEEEEERLPKRLE